MKTPKEWFDAQPLDDPMVEALAQQALAIDLHDKDPDNLPLMTALIMAGDLRAGVRATRMVDDGVPALDALPLVGSYARMGWLLDMRQRGALDDADVFRLLPQQWPMCDPDDTDPRFLLAWRRAWEANGKRPVLDDPDRPLPGTSRTIRVFRGQGEHQRVGIAWSLSEEVAQRFARGAAVRVPGGVPNPIVFKATVARRDVLAYLTGREEAEVIVSPMALVAA